jgi:hypothetical protein
MRTIPLLLLTGFLGIAITMAIVVKANGFNKTTCKQKPAKGFAVVELFTSEGCSSCPPADKLLAKIQQEYQNEPVFILAYHVDYWNRLGWKDVFSRSTFSDRQYQYVSWLNLQSAYTPQVIVNGAKEFIGSEESILRAVITGDLKNITPVSLELKPLELSGDRIKVFWEKSAALPNTSIVLSLIERSATTKVLKGENKGRELPHVQIVVDQQKMMTDSGTAYFKIPSGTTTKNFEVIGFLQNETNGKITGAAKSVFN